MWTHEETELLKTQHKHGFTVDESAGILEKSRLDITNKLISLGLKPRTEAAKSAAPEQVSIFQKEKPRKSRVMLTPEIEKRVCELRREGRNYENIANQVGVSKASVGRILQKNNFDCTRIYEKEPAPAAETSPEIKLSTVNDTTSPSFGQAQLQQIKAILESVDYCTMAKVGQAIGEAIGRIDTLINIMEERKK